MVNIPSTLQPTAPSPNHSTSIRFSCSFSRASKRWSESCSCHSGRSGCSPCDTNDTRNIAPLWEYPKLIYNHCEDVPPVNDVGQPTSLNSSLKHQIIEWYQIKCIFCSQSLPQITKFTFSQSAISLPFSTKSSRCVSGLATVVPRAATQSKTNWMAKNKQNWPLQDISTAGFTAWLQHTGTGLVALVATRPKSHDAWRMERPLVF